MGIRTSLNAMERRKILPLPGLELRLAGSQSAYRLRSSGSPNIERRPVILRSSRHGNEVILK
jgi:hypothetical protein